MGLRRGKRGFVAVSSAALVLGVLAAVPATADESAGDPLVDAMTSERAPGERTRTPAAAEGSAAGSEAVDGTEGATAAPNRRVAVIDELHADTPPDSQRAVRNVRVTQNLQTRRVQVKATYRAAPTAAKDSLLMVYVGEWSGNVCERRVALAGQAVGPAKLASFITGSDGNYTEAGSLGMSKSRSGAVLTFTSAADNRIRNNTWNCAFFDLIEPNPSDGEQPTLYQSSKFVDMDDHYPPKLRMDLGDRVQGNYRTKWTKMRIEVRNESPSAAGNVTITPKGPGLKFKPKKRNVGTINGRSTEYGITFQVRLKGKNPKKKQRKATFTAASGGKKFKQSVKIAEKPKPKKLKSLAGRYYWGFMPASADNGWDNRALWFVNRKWVHVGFSKNGKKPTCGKKAKACKRYTYNKRTGVVKFGGRKAKVTSEGFRIKAAKKDSALFYYPTTLAKRGQKFKLALLRNDFTGNCLIFCTVTKEWLSMDKKGRFILSSMSITSLGPPGTGSVFSSIPPDEKGRYKVQKNGRIVLNYANGKTVRHTLALEHDVRGKVSPQGEGVVLGDRNFYN